MARLPSRNLHVPEQRLAKHKAVEATAKLWNDFNEKLVRSSAIGKVSHGSFNPACKIRGNSVVLHPLEIVSIPVNQLGTLVANLSDQSQLIVAALDELFTRARK